MVQSSQKKNFVFIFLRDIQCHTLWCNQKKWLLCFMSLTTCCVLVSKNWKVYTWSSEEKDIERPASVTSRRRKASLHEVYAKKAPASHPSGFVTKLSGNACLLFFTVMNFMVLACFQTLAPLHQCHSRLKMFTWSRIKNEATKQLHASWKEMGGNYTLWIEANQNTFDITWYEKLQDSISNFYCT